MQSVSIDASQNNSIGSRLGRSVLSSRVRAMILSSVLLVSDSWTSLLSILVWSISRFARKFYPSSSRVPPYVFMSRFPNTATAHSANTLHPWPPLSKYWITIRYCAIWQDGLLFSLTLNARTFKLWGKGGPDHAALCLWPLWVDARSIRGFKSFCLFGVFG